MIKAEFVLKFFGFFERFTSRNRIQIYCVASFSNVVLVCITRYFAASVGPISAK